MILTDGELKTLIDTKANPLLTDFDPPAVWDDKDSPVQPCSLDLHIGAIYQPGVKPGKAGSAGDPKSELVLSTGQTAVVATKESIHLPADHAGYGFPPSHVSSRALLMTNPGHVDPGYSGKLQFTVINMGREDYVLRSKDLIVTLLIFKLGKNVTKDYAARRPQPAVDPPAVAPKDGKRGFTTARKLISKLAAEVSAYFAAGDSSGGTISQVDIDRLSPDFVDVQRRATGIAKRTLMNATLAASVAAVILTTVVNAAEKAYSGVDDVKTRLSKVEDANTGLTKELQTAKEQLEKQKSEIENLQKLESQPKPQGASR
jgi:deoxycytidine triphosphate deaminase